MLARLFIFIVSFICSCSLWAFTCYYTLVKDSCWTQYDVSVDVIDVAAQKVIISPLVPAGKSWVREKFTCSAAQNFTFHAKFAPIFWESDKGKTYSSKRFWPMPGTINEGDSAWDIPVCYPADFLQVPFPPTAKGNCSCDFSMIPVIPPKQIKPGS